MKRKRIRKKSKNTADAKSLAAEIRRLHQLSDADIDYSDIAATDAAFWADAEVAEPPGKSMISIRIDSDVLEWYRRNSRRYQTLINAVLRKYKESRQPQWAPLGWGDDSLTEFIEFAYRNRWATFANKRSQYKTLSVVDDCFMRVAKDWLNPNNIFSALLFFRSHSSYRSACEHALAGQITDLFPQLRACLEYAGYALHLYKNPDSVEKWVRRHDDSAATKAVKDEFKISNIKYTIKVSSRHTAKVFEELYQRSIDFGGHPNERAITGSLAIIEANDRQEFQQLYLHGDSLSLDHALKTTAQTGVCALEIFQSIFAARFEILGVTAELFELRKGL